MDYKKLREDKDSLAEVLGLFENDFIYIKKNIKSYFKLYEYKLNYIFFLEEKGQHRPLNELLCSLIDSALQQSIIVLDSLIDNLKPPHPDSGKVNGQIYHIISSKVKLRKFHKTNREDYFKYIIGIQESDAELYNHYQKEFLDYELNCPILDAIETPTKENSSILNFDDKYPTLTKLRNYYAHLLKRGANENNDIIEILSDPKGYQVLKKEVEDITNYLLYFFNEIKMKYLFIPSMDTINYDFSDSQIDDVLLFNIFESPIELLWILTENKDPYLEFKEKLADYKLDLKSKGLICGSQDLS